MMIGVVFADYEIISKNPSYLKRGPGYSKAKIVNYLKKELINELNDVDQRLSAWQKKKKSESDKLRKELNKRNNKTKKKARK